MIYEQSLSPYQLNDKLLIGLKKHLIIASDTSRSKADRLTSLNNMTEVLEYVLEDFNESIPEEEKAALIMKAV